MIIQPLQLSDIDSLQALQPPDWGDIKPHVINYINSSVFDPLKITIDNKVVGIGTTVKHRNTVWLAHIIVHPDFRNRGIGKRITDALVDSVDRNKYKTIYLIATELGYPVYLKSGFELEAEYNHFDIEQGAFKEDVSTFIIPYEKIFKPEILKLDKYVTGENRTVRLNEYIKESFIFRTGEKVTGAYFPKFGDGLIIALDAIAGIELMKFRLQTNLKAIIPAENKTASEYLIQNNFKICHISKRMRLGKRRKWRPENLYNRVSGQIG